MLQNMYEARKSGKIVQVISECTILPEGTKAVCYQELADDYPVYVLPKEQFDEAFCARVQNARVQNVRVQKKEENRMYMTPEKEPEDEREPEPKQEPAENGQEELSGLIRFLDAGTYREKIQILEQMKEELDDHILNNMAVSLDLSIDDGMDGYVLIMSELKIRSRFEGKRGERL